MCVVIKRWLQDNHKNGNPLKYKEGKAESNKKIFTVKCISILP